MKFIFEKATLKDAKEILELQKEAYQSEAEIYNDFSIPPLTQTLEEIIDDFKSFSFFVVKENDKIIGSIKINVDEDIVHIGRLIVSKSMQGKGIGSFLLQSAEKEFQSIGKYELFTGHLSTKNLSMYKNRGYKEFKREKLNDVTELIYLKK